MEVPAGCPHNTLHALTFEPPLALPDGRRLEGLDGWYRCPACGDTFNLQLIGSTRHAPDDLYLVAHGLLASLTPLIATQGEGDSAQDTQDTQERAAHEDGTDRTTGLEDG